MGNVWEYPHPPPSPRVGLYTPDEYDLWWHVTFLNLHDSERYCTLPHDLHLSAFSPLCFLLCPEVLFLPLKEEISWTNNERNTRPYTKNICTNCLSHLLASSYITWLILPKIPQLSFFPFLSYNQKLEKVVELIAFEPVFPTCARSGLRILWHSLVTVHHGLWWLNVVLGRFRRFSL